MARQAGSSGDRVGSRRRRPVIVREELKERMTSHWDMDLIPREELAREIDDGRREFRRWQWRQTGWVLLILALMCLGPTLGYWLGRAWGLIAGV